MAENQEEIKKLIIKSDILWRALDIIKAFISKNAFLPVLADAFFFNVSQKQIEIIGFDLINFIKLVFPVQTSDEFCGVLQFSNLYQFLNPKILPPEVVTISLNTNNYVLQVDYQRGKIKSGSENCLDYPNFKYPEQKTGLGLINAKILREKLRKMPFSKSYEDYKSLVSTFPLQLIALPKNINTKIPAKGNFEMFVSENYLILEGFFDNFYQAEMYFKKVSGIREKIKEEEFEAAKNDPLKRSMMLLVEDVLAQATILPENTKKTPKKHQESVLKEKQSPKHVNFIFEKAKKIIIDLQNTFPENEKDTNLMLEKGLAALKTCIDEKKDVFDAMRRYDLGSINFYYGVEGEKSKNYKKGYGIAHIIAKRDEEGRTIAQLKGQKGIEVAKKVVEAIAKGNIIKILEGNQTVWVEYQNYIAVLSFNKDGQEETWLLTGFKVIT